MDESCHESFPDLSLDLLTHQAMSENEKAEDEILEINRGFVLILSHPTLNKSA